MAWAENWVRQKGAGRLMSGSCKILLQNHFWRFSKDTVGGTEVLVLTDKHQEKLDC